MREPIIGCSSLLGAPVSADTPPTLERCLRNDIAFWIDPALDEDGIALGFFERTGGTSVPPYESLNLASHVGDDSERVDENRRRVLAAFDLGHLRERLTMAAMVHGTEIAEVDSATAGAGAFAAHGMAPLAGFDALTTDQPHVPLVACSADCVTIAFVAPGPRVALAHVGWRGALASFPGKAARAVAGRAGCETSAMRVYVGPHIGGCHYEIDSPLMSRFVESFGPLARAEAGGLDLGGVVTASLMSAGVDSRLIARVGACTAETTDRFFSYRAEHGLTGRHAALVCIR